jgi:type I restriction enzyme M protein
MRERYVKKPADKQKMQQALRACEKKQLPHMLCVTNMLLHDIDDPSFVHHDNTLARPYISYGQADRVDIVLTNPPFGGKEEDGIESNFPKHFQTRETADLFLALIVRLLKPNGRAAVVLPDGSLFGEGVKTRLKEHLMEECNLHTIVRLPNSVFKPYASIGTNLIFREGRADERDLVLRASHPRWPEGLLDDEADPLRAPEALHRLVGRSKTQRPEGNGRCLEGDGR